MDSLPKQGHERVVGDDAGDDVTHRALRDAGEECRDVDAGHVARAVADRIENGLYSGWHRRQTVVLPALNAAIAVGIAKIRLKRVDAVKSLGTATPFSRRIVTPVGAGDGA